MSDADSPEVAGSASTSPPVIHLSELLGQPVIARSGDSIGKVEDVVLDKLSNNIMFAVVSFGGFLGIGEKYHPIPWTALDYEPNEDAYVISYTKDQLKAAPADTIEELIRDDGITYRNKTYDYYGVTAYWH